MYTIACERYEAPGNVSICDNESFSKSSLDFTFAFSNILQTFKAVLDVAPNLINS